MLSRSCRATVHNPARTFGGASDWPPLPAPPPPAPTDLYFMCYADDHQVRRRWEKSFCAFLYYK